MINTKWLNKFKSDAAALMPNDAKKDPISALKKYLLSAITTSYICGMVFDWFSFSMWILYLMLHHKQMMGYSFVYLIKIWFEDYIEIKSVNMLKTFYKIKDKCEFYYLWAYANKFNMKGY